MQKAQGNQILNKLKWMNVLQPWWVTIAIALVQQEIQEYSNKQQMWSKQHNTDIVSVWCGNWTGANVYSKILLYI